VEQIAEQLGYPIQQLLPRVPQMDCGNAERFPRAGSVTGALSRRTLAARPFKTMENIYGFSYDRSSPADKAHSSFSSQVLAVIARDTRASVAARSDFRSAPRVARIEFLL